MGKFHLLIVCGLVLGFAQPGLAQSKATGKGEASGEQVEASGAGDQVLADAAHFCDALASNDLNILTELRSAGWQADRTEDIGNAPFYSEITASYTYDEVGTVDIWSFVETYPSNWVGYCLFTIANPEMVVDISVIGAHSNTQGSIEQQGEGVFGSWQTVEAGSSIFIHSYTLPEEFSYQVTMLTERRVTASE